MREADRNALLNAQDRLITRCTCGAWLYGSAPCGTCAWIYADKETAA
jgi:hypothetical protein